MSFQSISYFIDFLKSFSYWFSDSEFSSGFAFDFKSFISLISVSFLWMSALNYFTFSYKLRFSSISKFSFSQSSSTIYFNSFSQVSFLESSFWSFTIFSRSDFLSSKPSYVYFDSSSNYYFSSRSFWIISFSFDESSQRFFIYDCISFSLSLNSFYASGWIQFCFSFVSSDLRFWISSFYCFSFSLESLFFESDFDLLKFCYS